MLTKSSIQEKITKQELINKIIAPNQKEKKRNNKTNEVASVRNKATTANFSLSLNLNKKEKGLKKMRNSGKVIEVFIRRWWWEKQKR